MAKTIFSDRPYITFENLDVLEDAETDTRGFLDRYRDGAVFDEAQRCPRLFSFLQEIVDNGGKQCRFVLTGSQQFDVLSKITQSLAGRVANITLLPFSYDEWYAAQKIQPASIETVLFAGLYPPVLDRSLKPSTWYANYVQTYIERDVRQFAAIRDLRSFHLFLQMCAARSGNVLNLSGLASDCGIAVNTAKAWISILEASFILFLLQPHFNNFGKRLIKAPKLYFYDTGLLSYLLGIGTPETLQTHASRGQVFETYVISELKKWIIHRGTMDLLHFWRSKAGLEVDAVLENNGRLTGVEIKSGKTIASDFFASLVAWKKLAMNSVEKTYLVYGGDENIPRDQAYQLSWNSIGEVFAAKPQGA